MKITGFPRVKHGAGLVKPGMTNKGKGLMIHYSSDLAHPLHTSPVGFYAHSKKPPFCYSVSLFE
jgi:hypothetical protein